MQPKRWERQPGESNPAWEAKKAYIAMGPTRSQARVQGECSKSARLIARWSARWGWVEAAREHDDDQDRAARHVAQAQHQAKTKADIENYQKRDDQYRAGVHGAFMAAISTMSERIKRSQDPKGHAISPDEMDVLTRSIARMAPLAERALDRLGRRAGLIGLNDIQLVEPDDPHDPFDPEMQRKAKAAMKAFEEA